jgi:hypothetical protein
VKRRMSLRRGMMEERRDIYKQWSIPLTRDKLANNQLPIRAVHFDYAALRSELVNEMF